MRAARAYNHWPWPWEELDGDQKQAVICGVAGHCSRTALGTDGSAGLHEDPVAVLDFASLYPSVFISANICYSTLLPPKAHTAAGLTTHRTPDTVGPNCRVPKAVGVDDTRAWPGDAIAFVDSKHHVGLLPQLLQALISERRVVKKRIKELSEAAVAAASSFDDDVDVTPGGPHDAGLIEVLNARQMTLKLLSNASYGFTGADTSHLCCKPLAEACLRFGNYYTRTASALIEAQGLAHDASRHGGGTSPPPPRFPGAAVIYANTDSLFVKLPGRTTAQAVAEGKQMAEFVSSHPCMPSALTLEFERVLSPLLLDAHNRYAGAEFVLGQELTGTLHQKGLVERRQCTFVTDVVKGALEKLLVQGDQPAAVDFCCKMAASLLGGEVPSASLVEGGFLKRADQRDLLRMAGLGKDADKKVDKATREADETLRKENAVSLAIELLKRSATADKMPTVVYRQGEYVPFVAVRRSGGAAALKQFENVEAPDLVIQLATPVDLKLLFERRLLPALIGQVKEVSGKATKEAAEADKPALIGRILTPKARQEMRYGAHSRKAFSGVLTCEEGWRLFGMSAAPPEPSLQGRGGQSKIASFFGAGAAKTKQDSTDGGSAGRRFASGEGGSSAPPAVPETKDDAVTTPGADVKDVAAALDDEVIKWEAEVARIHRLRMAISLRHGHEASFGEKAGLDPLLAPPPPLLLHNHASELANAIRLLDAAKRKRARRNGTSPVAKV